MAGQPHSRGYEKTAHLYDLFDRKKNVKFFFHYAATARDVLDIGAGTGRIAIPLAKRGVNLWCVEPSTAMRREFKRKLVRWPELSGQITIVAGDACTFQFGRTFPVALMSGSFDHLVDDSQRMRALTNIGRHLDPGGVLVFDVFLGLMHDAPPSPAGEVVLGDREIRRYVGGRVLPGDQKEVMLIFEIWQGGKLVECIEEHGLVGITSRAGVRRVLEHSGFQVGHEWSDYQFTPYQEDESLLVVEAIKRS